MSIKTTRLTTEIESAKAPTEMESAEAPTNVESAKAPTEKESAQAPTGKESAKAPTAKVTIEINLKHSNLYAKMESYDPEKINEFDVTTEQIPKRLKALSKTLEELKTLIYNFLLDFPKADVIEKYWNLLIKATSDTNQYKRRALEKAIEAMQGKECDLSIIAEEAKETKLEDSEDEVRDNLEHPITLESNVIDEDNEGNVIVEFEEVVISPKLAQVGGSIDEEESTQGEGQSPRSVAIIKHLWVGRKLKELEERELQDEMTKPVMKMTLNWMLKRTKEEMLEIKWSREDHEGVVNDEKVLPSEGEDEDWTKELMLNVKNPASQNEGDAIKRISPLLQLEIGYPHWKSHRVLENLYPMGFPRPPWKSRPTQISHGVLEIQWIL